jgi:ATP-dependent Lon protease
MSIAEANLDLPASFAGIVKLFPLPNLVLFPGVIQPLHIFEPRYRALMRDALESDQLIAMATLRPGSESQPGNAPMFPTVCIGKIVTHAKLKDGRFNLLLCGARRAKIIREIPASTPYRMADVKLVDADPFDCHDDRANALRDPVLDLYRQLVDADTSLDREAFETLVRGQMPLGLLMDLVAFSCGAGVVQQHGILETVDLLARGNRLLRILQARLQESRDPAGSRFPPQFSYN